MAGIESLARARTGATGFGTRIGRFVMVAAWALIVVGALLNDQFPFTPWVIWPLAAGLAGAILVTRRGASMLQPAYATAVVACAVIAGAVIFGMQLQNEILWFYTFASYLLGALAARGNMRIALTGATVVWGMGAVFAWQNGATVSGYLIVLSMPMLVLAVCVTWNLALVRVATHDMQYRSEAERARLAKAAAERHAATTHEQLAVMRREVSPLLTRITAGESITGDLQLELRIAEARVRDRIRSPHLLHPELESAILEVRLRGGEVVLIGGARLAEPELPKLGIGENFAAGTDPAPMTDRIGDDLAHAVAEEIRALDADPTVTIRSMPENAETALSLVIRSGTDTSQIRFTHDGAVLSRK